jgi:hypothetical protein
LKFGGSVFQPAFLFCRVDLNNSEITEAFKMDGERSSTSASIVLESYRTRTEGASTLLDDTDTINASAMTSFTTALDTSSKPSLKPVNLQQSNPNEMMEAQPESLSVKSNVGSECQPLLKTHEDED